MGAVIEQTPELRELEQRAWGSELGALSRGCPAAACVRITARGRVPLEEIPRLFGALQGIRYDPRRGELEVVLGETPSLSALRCFMSKPRRIYEGRSPDGRVILVVEHGGTRTVIEIGARAALGPTPPAAARGALVGAVGQPDRR